MLPHSSKETYDFLGGSRRSRLRELRTGSYHRLMWCVDRVYQAWIGATATTWYSDLVLRLKNIVTLFNGRALPICGRLTIISSTKITRWDWWECLSELENWIIVLISKGSSSHTEISVRLIGARLSSIHPRVPNDRHTWTLQGKSGEAYATFIRSQNWLRICFRLFHPLNANYRRLSMRRIKSLSASSLFPGD